MAPDTRGPADTELVVGAREAAKAPRASQLSPVDLAVRKWSKKRGALIMMLHEIQNQLGYVPREHAIELGQRTGVPLARIYEVLSFYHYFKLEQPGRAVISVCTGTACHLQGAPELVAAFSEELGIETGQSTPDRLFHLQSVRCVGACGLAPVVVVNRITYGKCQPAQVRAIVHEWGERFTNDGGAPVAASQVLHG